MGACSWKRGGWVGREKNLFGHDGAVAATTTSGRNAYRGVEPWKRLKHFSFILVSFRCRRAAKYFRVIYTPPAKATHFLVGLSPSWGSEHFIFLKKNKKTTIVGNACTSTHTHSTRWHRVVSCLSATSKRRFV